MKLCTINDTLSNLINSEGPILRIFRERESGALFARGLTAPANSEIFCRINHFTLKLYLKSRITLSELFLLRADEHFIIRTHGKGQAIAKFLEVSREQYPDEITELRCGTDLYQLLSRNSRPAKSVAEIIEMLPSVNISPPSPIGGVKVANSYSDFFNDQSGPIRVVTIENEDHNEDEHDYIECSTINEGEKVLTRINPMALQLFVTGRITVAELFQLRQDDYYFLIKDNNAVRTGYTNQIKSIIESMSIANSHYFSLPTEIQVDAPLENWGFYQDHMMINGKGILPAGFESQYKVDLNTKNSCR